MMLQSVFLLLCIFSPPILSHFSVISNLGKNVANTLFIPIKVANNLIRHSQNIFLRRKPVIVNQSPSVVYNIRNNAFPIFKFVPANLKYVLNDKQPAVTSSQIIQRHGTRPKYRSDFSLDHKYSIDIFERKLYLVSSVCLFCVKNNITGIHFVYVHDEVISQARSI